MTDAARPIAFPDDWADRTITGMPLAESILSVFIGRCQSCGSAPAGQREGSVLTNTGHIDGVLYGDTFCAGCYEGDPDGIVFSIAPSTDNERLA